MTGEPTARTADPISSSRSSTSPSDLSSTPPGTTQQLASQQTSKPSGSLSQPSKIGIGIDIPFAVTTLAVLVFLFVRRLRGREKRARKHGGGESSIAEVEDTSREEAKSENGREPRWTQGIQYENAHVSLKGARNLEDTISNPVLIICTELKSFISLGMTIQTIRLLYCYLRRIIKKGVAVLVGSL